MMITLRHAEEVIPVSELDLRRDLLLRRRNGIWPASCIEALSGEFEPEAYHDQYQQRIRELIDAKRRGKKVKAKRAPRRRPAGHWPTLQASLKGVSHEPVAREGTGRSRMARATKKQTSETQSSPREKTAVPCVLVGFAELRAGECAGARLSGDPPFGSPAAAAEPGGFAARAPVLLPPRR